MPNSGGDSINGADPSGMYSAQYQSEVAGRASLAIGALGVIATASGAGAPVGIGLGLISTGLSIYSRAVVGDTGGAVSAGLLGGVTAGLGGLGAYSGASQLSQTLIRGGYSGLEAGAGFFYR